MSVQTKFATLDVVDRVTMGLDARIEDVYPNEEPA